MKKLKLNLEGKMMSKDQMKKVVGGSSCAIYCIYEGTIYGFLPVDECYYPEGPNDITLEVVCALNDIQSDANWTFCQC